MGARRRPPPARVRRTWSPGEECLVASERRGHDRVVADSRGCARSRAHPQRRDDGATRLQSRVGGRVANGRGRRARRRRHPEARHALRGRAPGGSLPLL
eukprot:scaffold246844_cov26-Tisochrysis_lutea.AAC.3